MEPASVMHLSSAYCVERPCGQGSVGECIELGDPKLPSSLQVSNICDLPKQHEFMNE